MHRVRLSGAMNENLLNTRAPFSVSGLTHRLSVITVIVIKILGRISNDFVMRTIGVRSFFTLVYQDRHSMVEFVYVQLQGLFSTFSCFEKFNKWAI